MHWRHVSPSPTPISIFNPRTMLRLLLLRSRPLSTRRFSSLPPDTNRIKTNHIPSSCSDPDILPILSQQKRSPSVLSPSHRSFPFYALSATLISAIAASAAFASSYHDSASLKSRSEMLYADLEHSLGRSGDSLRRVLDRMRQTGLAAAVLWKSLRSVLSSANHEVRLGFELRVAALLADIAAANESRRLAIVGAGGGAVVDWLLDTVASPSADAHGTQGESARALAYLVADPKASEAVLGRPGAVPKLLRFIFSFQPHRAKKQNKRSSWGGVDSWKGRSMLIAAIMDIVTSNCDNMDRVSFKPNLSGNAETGDIAAALQVIEEGSMHLDEPPGNDNEDGGKGLRGVGIKVLGGTTVLGFSRTNGFADPDHSDTSLVESVEHIPGNHLLQKCHISSPLKRNLSNVSVPGLWDDLHCEHIAVPFAAWALANWAMVSDVNRSRIQELDRDGHAVMTALTAPERTVKWHASLVARLLLEDQNLPLIESVPDWTVSLLSTAFHASKSDDISLAQMALSAFLVSVERSIGAKTVVMDKRLDLMRQIAKQTEKHQPVQEALAKALELLCAGNCHLSLEESQKWSSVLLPWVCGKLSTDFTRVSATKIVSCILEDYGPDSIPISQAWLTVLLSEILSNKTASSRGSTQFKSEKVKTQIDPSKALVAGQAATQLASSVVNLSRKQMGTTTDPSDGFALADLLSLEPFSNHLKNIKKDSLPEFDAADSAFATLKGIKALTEICVENLVYQEKLVDFGVLCLLRRFLLRDDYEQLAANEAYDASKILETRDRAPEGHKDASVTEGGSSSVRVPPSKHIRRHAARLLTILSLLPKVQKALASDEIWCKWLEDCANGKVPGCNDLKIQSYARASLLNLFCLKHMRENAEHKSAFDLHDGKLKNMCPKYDDMIFLLNPEFPPWMNSSKNHPNCQQNSPSSRKSDSNGNSSSPCPDEIMDGQNEICREDSDDDTHSSVDDSKKCSQPPPLLDVVFVHGLRGGPFKTWRIAENKSSTTSRSGLVENIDQDAGKQGTCWPREWLAADFPSARLFTVKYKTNFTQWSGASLPLQEVSSMLLRKLVAAGIGSRPIVFVTHSMGGLVVKQLLYQAKAENLNEFFDNTIGVVFYSCPHFGSKLADMPWRMGLVFRPAPSIGELRSGSERLVELNDFVRHLHNKGLLDVLSFSETQVTPIVEGYGGWALRMEIVPIESAYPGFGELVVLDATDHINSCKPVSRTDPSYTETLNFLEKLKAQYT